jgi:hypothetical protein
MDGCYWSGGSEIKCGQLDQRGDAGSISLPRFVIIPSSPMQPIELPLCKAIFDRHFTALDKTSRPGGRLAQTFSLCAARKIHGASRLGHLVVADVDPCRRRGVGASWISLSRHLLLLQPAGAVGVAHRFRP